MSRLTERQSAGYDLIEMKGAWCDNYCGEQSKVTCRDCAIWKAIQKLAYYEDMEEQGLLLELPCKVGDTVYFVLSQGCHSVGDCDGHCYGCNFAEYGIEAMDFEIVDYQFLGDSLFLTKEEAEAKLEEKKHDNTR